MMLDGLHADGGGEMRLARSWSADEHDVVGVRQELAAVQLSHQRLVDLAGGEVEAGEVAIVRKARGLELVSGGPHLPAGHLRLEQLRQNRQRRLESRRALLGQFANGLRHAVC